MELDLTNYATKDDVKNITHVDVSSFASKTNLASLKTEVDKIDTDKLKTVPHDLAKLSNVVNNDVVKKTDFNPLKTEVDGLDASNYVSRTKFEKDIKDLDDTIDEGLKRIPDVSGLATKTSLNSLLPTSTFNSKIIEIENKIKTAEGKIPNISGLATKTELTAIENKIADVTGYVKKTDYATEITSIKNEYVTNASLDSKLNDLKAQHIADEVKKVDDKVKMNASDILKFESRLKQKEGIVDGNQRGLSFNRGLFYYTEQSYLVYECKTWSFSFNNNKTIKLWKSTGMNNLSRNSDLDAVSDSTLLFPSFENNGRINVKLRGNYFTQTKMIAPNTNKVVTIYIAYMLDPINHTRNTDYTIQNTLFGAVSITKNADSSKNRYEGYGPCFDEGGMFSVGNINNDKNVMIFGVHESSLTHANNKNNNIYVIGHLFVQGINDSTL